MTRDQVDIVLIAAGWAAAAGVVGLLVGYLAAAFGRSGG